MKYPSENDRYMRVEVVDGCIKDIVHDNYLVNPLKACLVGASITESEETL